MPDNIPRGPYEAQARAGNDARLDGLDREDFICLFFDPDDPENKAWLRANLSPREVLRLPRPFREAIRTERLRAARSA